MPLHDLLICILITVKVASIATLTAALLGLFMAWVMTQKGVRGKSLLDALCTLPLVLPPTVIGYCLILFFGRHGAIGQWLNEFGISIIFSWHGAVIAATVVTFPLTYRASRAALESVDHSLENAARTLGATEFQVFFRVSLPLAWRSIVAGVSLAFARGMGEFGATLMIAGNLPGKTQTLSLAIYAAFQAESDSKAFMLVVVTSILCASLLFIAESFANGKRIWGKR